MHGELLVGGGARGTSAFQPRVESAARHFENVAEYRYRRGGLLRRDERELHVLSLAKKAVAFFRMSRSIRSVFTSRLSAASSSRSDVVSAPAAAPLPLPLSMSACRTHARTEVSVRL